MTLHPSCTGKHPYASATRAWWVARKPKLWRGRHIGKHFKSARAHYRYEE